MTDTEGKGSGIPPAFPQSLKPPPHETVPYDIKN